MPVTLKDVQVAAERIREHVKHTPLVRAEKLDEKLGCQEIGRASCRERV